MGRRVAAAIVTFFVFGTAVEGLTRLDRSAQLFIRFATNRIATSLEDAGIGIADENRYSIRARESADIWIHDPNPLLFKYEVTTVLSDTEDYKAATALAKELGVLLARFPASGASGDATDSVVEGLALMEFRDAIVGLQKGIGFLGGWIAKSLEPDTAKLKQEVADAQFPRAAEIVEAGYARVVHIWSKCLAGQPLAGEDGLTVSCDDPFDLRGRVRHARRTAELSAARVALREAEAAAAKAQATAAQAQAGVTAAQKHLAEARAKGTDVDAAEQALAVADAALAQDRALSSAADVNVSSRRATIAELQSGVASALVAMKQAAASAAAGQTIRSFITAVMAGESHVRSSMTTLLAFDKDVQDLHVPRRVEQRTHSIQRQTITVSVKPETKYERYLSAEIKKRRAEGVRAVRIVIEPHTTVSLRPGVGFVLGFLRNPTFSTVREGDAFRIVENDSDLTRYNVAAMLNIVPGRWDEPTFGGYFQVGISPKNDETGFFFGGGISAQTVFTFGGGLMIQQVRELGPGLSLDRPIARPEDLKTRTTFKPALYLHGTVVLPLK